MNLSWSLLYGTVLCSRADSLCSNVSKHESVAFYSLFLNIHRSGVLTALVWLVPHETAAILMRSVCTMSLHEKPHMWGHACLAVTCHLHFWHNDQDLLHATVVTHGCNGYWNKSKHTKLTLEKNILLPLLLGSEPMIFQSRVWHSDHWAFSAIANILFSNGTY